MGQSASAGGSDDNESFPTRGPTSGAATSQEKQETFDEEEVKKAFKNLNHENLQKAPEAFRAAYADDAKGLTEIERLVAEIEAGGKATSTTKESAVRAEKAAVAKKKAAAVERRTVRAADQEASEWLKEQLKLHEESEKKERIRSSPTTPGSAKKNPEQKDKGAGSNKTSNTNSINRQSASTVQSNNSSSNDSKNTRSATIIDASANTTSSNKSTDNNNLFTFDFSSINKNQTRELNLFGKEEQNEKPSSVVKAAKGGIWSDLSSIPPPVVPQSFADDKDAAAPPPPAIKVIEQFIPELYSFLGVNVDATFEEIKQGYRKQALRWHPDKNRGKNEAKAAERFKRINEAFDTLFDPQKRSAYDSGQVKLPTKAKRLQGHGWADVKDEDDAALTPLGVKMKKQSWVEHVYFGGRVDDVDPVYEEHDPRTPQERAKVFWRRIGEKAHEARDDWEGSGDGWLKQFILDWWKDTPSRWPSGLELQGMNETSQEEWKERRMVYNRRKMKVLLHIEAHEAYLEIPNLEQKIKERLQKIWPGRIQD
eukprot:TRINITY_DN32325_c0_g1_i1.p1 TRINITY_DN32325_c0_g1~~TRINITY_DN32325_c0_g1_i1.p1  ORF type:complete len:538 (-),score=139.09 TRINITY_DN32325_c0_g1_i1:329-1942(-)